MNIDAIHDLHIAAVEIVNKHYEAGDTVEEYRAIGRLEAIRDCLVALGYHRGQLIITADTFYINQGIDRPMCGGMFLTRLQGEGATP